VRPLIKLKAGVTSRLPAGTAWHRRQLQNFCDAIQILLHKSNKINLQNSHKFLLWGGKWQLCSTLSINEMYHWNNYLIPCRRVLLGKLIVAQLVKKFPASSTALSSLPCSAGPATGRYSELGAPAHTLIANWCNYLCCICIISWNNRYRHYRATTILVQFWNKAEKNYSRNKNAEIQRG
jgi:hypothetical protein